MIETLKQKVLRGEALTDEEAYRLADTADREALYEAAAEITRHYGKPAFNPCSIINARTGQCSENCKWCAQSAHYATHADTHGIVSTPQVLQQAQYDERKGVKCFCQVTSGRTVKGGGPPSECGTGLEAARGATRLHPYQYPVAHSRHAAGRHTTHRG